MESTEMSYGERMKAWANWTLVDMGYPDPESRAVLDPRVVRDKIPAIPQDLTRMVREERARPRVVD